MTSPTARTLATLRKEGWTAEVVEKWNPHAGPINPKTKRPVGGRKDLFGFADVLALKGDRGTLAVQACAMSGRAAHLAKLQAVPATLYAINAGWLVEVWAWRKVLVKTKRGTKVKRWAVERTTLTVTDSGLVVPVNSYAKDHKS